MTYIKASKHLRLHAHCKAGKGQHTKPQKIEHKKEQNYKADNGEVSRSNVSKVLKVRSIQNDIKGWPIEGVNV